LQKVEILSPQVRGGCFVKFYFFFILFLLIAEITGGEIRARGMSFLCKYRPLSDTDK